MLEQLQGFHIEPTNICTLKCSKCARTQFINQFPKKWKNKNLNLEDLKKFLDINIEKKVFRMCGNYGDPIYYSQLFDLVQWIKSNNGLVQIYTNGSYKSKNWWENLCALLTTDDSIYFAIDGVPSNFTHYRINADWNSIKEGIQQAVKTTTTIWKYIPFSFNEDNIEQAKKLASDLGMEFLIDPTDRWSSDSDPLKSNKFLGQRYNQVVNWTPTKQTTIDAACKKTNYHHYISADGYYMPCCFVGDYRFFYQSEFYKNRKKYDIRNTTISEVLLELSNFYNTIETQNQKYCQFNCPQT